MIIKENWKTIKDYPLYKISDHGRVMSYAKSKEGKILKHNLLGHGYEFIILYRPDLGAKVSKNFLVHRLVAMAFVPITDTTETVNHKDGNKLNNHYTNLEWMSYGDNNRHGFALGLFKNQNGVSGERNGNAKLTAKQVSIIRYSLSHGATRKDLSSIFNISQGHVGNIQVNKTWK